MKTFIPKDTKYLISNASPCYKSYTFNNKKFIPKCKKKRFPLFIQAPYKSNTYVIFSDHTRA